jgi:hypothetical protein
MIALALTDAQLATLVAAARDLSPSARSVFLEQVAAQLPKTPHDGEVAEACRQALLRSR